jgi:hypothetical protein
MKYGFNHKLLGFITFALIKELVTMCIVTLKNNTQNYLQSIYLQTKWKQTKKKEMLLKQLLFQK